MRTAESISHLVRSEECVLDTKTLDIEAAVPLRKSSSEDIQLDKKSRSNPLKLKKLKSLRSRLSLRFRSLRDSRLVVLRRASLDNPKYSRQDIRNLKFAEDFTSDSGRESPKTDLENSPVAAVEPKKKKRKLVKRFSLNSFRWKKVKSADDCDAVTTATQTSPTVPDRPLERNNSRGPFDRVQKILITISGRKTKPKEKNFSGDISNGLNINGQTDPASAEPKLNITHSERDTPPSERAPARPNQRPRNSQTSTVASPDTSPTNELVRQDTGAVRKSVRAVRLERQVSRDEARGDENDDEKFRFLRRDISQERGVRFPRPSSSYTDSTKLSKAAREEKLNRILDYVSKTCSQNNLNESTTVNDKEAPIDTPPPERNISASPSLRQIREERRNSSLFHSANSNESGSPVSDAGRRRIKYVGQATFYTDEEKEILEGKRQTFINLSGISEYSFESEYSSESAIMPAYGDLVMDAEEAPIMTSGTEKREHLYKILVIGELGAGKTSFIKRYVHQFFSANYRATIGVDFALKVLHWDQNTIVRLQLWDIAGQERFGNMTRVYYKEAVGAFIVFDVTRSGTFDAVSKWKEDLDSKVQLPGGGSIPCILLANKCDQEKQGIVTNPEKMDEYVKENGFSGWFETSAKENINIEEAARALVSQILLNDKLITQADIIDNDRFALGNTSGPQANSTDRKSCFC